MAITSYGCAFVDQNLRIMTALSDFINHLKGFRNSILQYSLLIPGLLLVLITHAQTGNVCETPLQISTLPYSHSGNTATYGNDYSYDDVPPAVDNPVSTGSFATYYLESYDVVYAYTPSQDDYVDAFLLGNGDLSALWVFTGCPFEYTLGWDLFYNNEEREVLSIPVLAGQTYYFVLSSYPNNPSFSYTFELHESPNFDCPALSSNIGNSCDDNDNLTINDVITADCNCEGLLIDADATFLLPQSLECGQRFSTVSFYEPGTNNMILYKSGYSPNNSAVFYAYQVPVGTYDVYLTVEGMLNIKLENHTTISGNNSIQILEAQLGDINNDNAITVLDFSAFSYAFASTEGDENYNFLANLNCDLSVNLLDVSLMSASFGLQGVSIP